MSNEDEKPETPPSIGIPQDVKIGTPKVTRTWPKVPVKTEVQKAGDRFVALVHFEGVHTERLPGLHPTKLDAELTLEAWVKENVKP